jgi:hypothetical protein
VSDPELLAKKLEEKLDSDSPEDIVTGMAHLVLMKDKDFRGKEKLYTTLLTAMAGKLYLKLMLKQKARK